VITLGSSVISVSTPTIVTLPIHSTTTYAITTPASTPVVPPASTLTPGSVGTTSGTTGPSPTTSGPVQVTNAAGVNGIGLGAIAAGLAAMIL
jgi:hypothetical protein